MSLEIRTAIHFLWLKDLPNAVISREIDSVYGERVIGLRVIQSGRTVSRTATTASKTGRQLVVLAQSNMWARFARYSWMIHIF
jgi:hypothetical protein